MKNKFIKISIILFTFLISGYLLSLIIINSLMNIELIGNKVINVSYGDTYQDEGIKINFNKKDISDKVKIEDNTNYQELGNYYIKYHIKYLWFNKAIERKINVIDNEKPIITLNGDNPLYLTYGKEYIEPGYTATDNYSDNLEVSVSGIDKINNKNPGTYLINYELLMKMEIILR